MQPPPAFFVHVIDFVLRRIPMDGVFFTTGGDFFTTGGDFIGRFRDHIGGLPGKGRRG